MMMMMVIITITATILFRGNLSGLNLRCHVSQMQFLLEFMRKKPHRAEQGTKKLNLAAEGVIIFFKFLMLSL